MCNIHHPSFTFISYYRPKINEYSGQYSPNILWIIIPRKMRWAGHEDMININTILVAKPKTPKFLLR
jgi:hypothetical protein